MNEPLSLVVDNKTDKQIADDIRAKALEAIKPLMAVMNEAAALGFQLDYQIGRDFAKRAVINALMISKQF